MAKLSSIENNKKRIKMVASKRITRDSLKKIIMDRSLTLEERIQANFKLAEMPRNSSYTRIRNRCELSGRPRGYYRKFKISRIALRNLAAQGLIPGITKSSW